MTDNEDLWKSLGKVIGSVLKGITKVIKVISPLLQSFGKTLKTLTEILGDFSGAIAVAFAVLPLMRFISAAGGLSAVAAIFGSSNI